MFEIHFKINTLRPRQNRGHFADDIFKCIFLNENAWVPIKILLKLVPRGPINNIPALVQIMAWRRLGDKPLFEPMMVSLPTHICVTRPQWVNICINLKCIICYANHITIIRKCCIIQSYWSYIYCCPDSYWYSLSNWSALIISFYISGTYTGTYLTLNYGHIMLHVVEVVWYLYLINSSRLNFDKPGQGVITIYVKPQFTVKLVLITKMQYIDLIYPIPSVNKIETNALRHEPINMHHMSNGYLNVFALKIRVVMYFAQCIT